MNPKAKEFFIENLAGFLFINDLYDLYKYRDEIDSSIENNKIYSLALFFNDDTTTINITGEQKKELYNWINLLHIPTIAVIKGQCADMLELSMLCDIRLCGNNASIKFPNDDRDLSFNFIEQCQLLMGKYRDVDQYKALLGQTIEADEAYRKRLINQIIDKENLIIEVKKYMDKILAGRPDYQIRAIMKCFKNYKFHGINSDEELLLEQESRQFCHLILKEYQKSRVCNEN